MLINSILPWVTLVSGAVVPKIKQAIDQRFSGDVYKTTMTGMIGYRNLYSGPAYTIHFKYSGVINVVYITMLYGIGMPLLFPLAAFNFFNQWLTERIIVAYQVRLPPALNDQLTKNAINLLKLAPLVMLCNGYWIISNR